MSKSAKEASQPLDKIIIKGARVHNLKNIDITIPRDQLVVITGLSGSGKSSLAFDTLYAEGQRRYVESLSSYARQFLGKLEKPEVDYIQGISPAIAIEQKVNSKNPRSTVGTTTEIYDYLKLLFAKIGKTIDPETGEVVKKHSVTDVIDFIQSQEDGLKGLLTAPITFPEGRKKVDHLGILLQQGFSRVLIDNEIVSLQDAIDLDSDFSEPIELLINRFKTTKDEEQLQALADSIQTGFYEGAGTCSILLNKTLDRTDFTNRFESNGKLFVEPSEDFFSFNSPHGACPKCEGFGKTIGIHEDLVIPDPNKSVYQGTVACWNGEKLKTWKNKIVMNVDEVNFPIHKAYIDLSDEEKDLLWDGCKAFQGINQFFAKLEAKQYKIQNRVMLARYRGRTKCNVCKGKRLRKETYNVKIDGFTINDLVDLPINELEQVFNKLKLDDHDAKIAERLLLEINNRISYLQKVGLTYLSINRLSSSLSGGESQRINLATSLGSSLVGSMYVLDEPSIGLHPRDTKQLIEVLNGLKELGNTVIVVEHEEDVIMAADQIIDIGPEAGSLGGELIFQGDIKQLRKAKGSLTADYINKTREIVNREIKSKFSHFIEIKGAQHNNLKNIDVKFPLYAFTCVSGVSGSGKSTLIRDILYPGLLQEKEIFKIKPGLHKAIEGAIDKVEEIEFIDQNPIGKSSRSNPSSYVKAYDDIRQLFVNQTLSKLNGFKPSAFSFNVEGGRCEVCLGEGTVNIEMQFMADIQVQCDNCKGKRFKEDVLEVTYREKNIFDILELTIQDAYDFFQIAIDENAKEARIEKKINNKLKCLLDVGMGYVKMGQSSSTLSGGEAQRVKLASYLTKSTRPTPTLFIFDEPTTGLHFHDIHKLLKSFDALIQLGHTVIVIEHNTEVLKAADWIIDLGPEAGIKGGNLVYQGSVNGLKESKESYTATYL